MSKVIVISSDAMVGEDLDYFQTLPNFKKDVRDYLDESGADISGMSDEELEEASEVFALPNGQYLIVEG